MDLFSLAGKTALVTGCTKGIGKAMAAGLAEAGADVIGVSGSLELSGSGGEQGRGSHRPEIHRLPGRFIRQGETIRICSTITGRKPGD